MGITSKIKTPHGAFIIWNYKNRLGNYEQTDAHSIEEIVVSTKTVISMTTTKRKSTPAGAFEVRLAPNLNWISKITPGSWCAILMSQNTPINIKSGSNLGTADEKTMKMLGRIDSVRIAVDVDQETGTRKTEYVITGVDWGAVFDTKVYIDPINANNILDKVSSIGHAALITADGMILDWSQDLPTSTNMVAALMKVWGAPLSGAIGSVESALEGSVNKADTGSQKIIPPIQLTSDSQFLMPSAVASYMGFINKTTFMTKSHMEDIIKLYAGVLKGYNQYEDNKEAFGFIDPHSLYKVNTLWQMLMDNCNSTINELVTDMAFVGGLCELRLLKRVKPFINRDFFPGSFYPHVQNNISKFSNVKANFIPYTDVININAGTNWRDRVNFIEIRPQQQLVQINFDSAVKLEQQVIYQQAYEREGFRPLVETTKYMPFSLSGELDPFGMTQWKNLLAEWYFNTDLMLNGSMTIMGQDFYIAVGDNIQVNSKVLGLGAFNSPQSQGAGSEDTYLLAHVESVSHQFGVNPETGARSFYTTVNFVRGIITDKNRVILSPFELATALDPSAADLPQTGEKNTNVYVSTSHPGVKAFDTGKG